MHHSEAGLINKMFACFEEAAKTSSRASSTRLYESLDDYLSEKTDFAALVINNFSHIFGYFFLVCMLIGIAFIVHHLIKLIIKVVKNRIIVV